MAQRTREQLNTANAALFVNNSTGDITPALEKAFNEDVNDSAVNIKGDTFAADAEFAFQNGSKFREGAIPHGFGGGIARVCANEKADQWEDGFRYLIETVGSTNTVVYAETINNIIPDDTYDETDDWAVGSRLTNLVTGVTYECTQANEGDAIWIPASTPSRQFRVALSESELLNGVTKDIPELPAPGAGFAWSLYNAELSYSFGTEQYDATDVFVQPQGQRHQYNAETAINDASESFFIGMVRNNCGLNQAVTIAENTKMQIKVESTSTTGDGTAVVYGIARLITV